jgi:hypothetical protein
MASSAFSAQAIIEPPFAREVSTISPSRQSQTIIFNHAALHNDFS